MNYKEITQIKDLNRGDIVRHKSRTGPSYIVDAVYGDRATAMAAADMTHAEEWEVMKPETTNQSLDSIQQELAEIREDNSRAVRVKGQPEESARQAVAKNKKHAEFNRLFSRIGPKVKPEYRHQRVVITD